MCARNAAKSLLDVHATCARARTTTARGGAHVEAAPLVQLTVNRAFVFIALARFGQERTNAATMVGGGDDAP